MLTGIKALLQKKISQFELENLGVVAIFTPYYMYITVCPQNLITEFKNCFSNILILLKVRFAQKLK